MRSTIPFEQLPESVQKEHGFDPEEIAKAKEALAAMAEASTSPDSESENSSNSTTPALNMEGRLKISPEAEELVAAIVNAPFGRSQLPLSSAALGEVKARMLEAAPYSATQATLEKGKHYIVVGKSMTCSMGLRSKRFTALQDLNRKRFALLLRCFTSEDFDGVNFAKHHVVCFALYVRDLDGTPVFLPVLVSGPSAQRDHLIVIRPEYDDSEFNSPLGAILQREGQPFKESIGESTSTDRN